MDKFEAEQLAGNPDIEHWSSYVGQGAIRFVLSFDVQPANPFFGQTIIVTKNLEARDQLRGKFQKWLKDQFPGTDAFVHLLDIGPPVGRPVQYRVSGPDLQKVRDFSQQMANLVAENPSIGDITFDWNEPSRVIKVDVLQDKARQLGITSESIASALNVVVGGTTVTQVRDSIYLVDVVARARADERGSIDQLRNIELPASNGQSVPTAAVANFHYELEQPVVWRRARQPTITLKASVLGALQPATVVSQLAPKVKEFAGKLPAGYGIVVGGAVEESSKSQAPIAAVTP